MAEQNYCRDGAAVVAGDAVGLASVCQVGDAVATSRPSKLLTRLTVANASKPGIASLVTDVSKNAPALEGRTELFVCEVEVLDDFRWLPFAA